jgi:outer membrane protein assembly factor BamB
MHSFSSLFLAATLSLATASSPAADWPRFRGPHGDGTSTDPGVPLKWGDADVAWRRELPGPGSSSPIVVGNAVLLSSYSGYGVELKNPGDAGGLTRHAICLNRADGKLLWQKDVKHPSPDRPYQGQYITMHGYASSTPVSDGVNVYFFFGPAGVRAYSLQGRELWSASVGDKAHDWGNGSSPILHGNLVIVNAALEGDALVALDKKTGKEVWAVRKGFPSSWNSPVVAKVGAREELIVNASGRLRAFDPATGTELWSCRGIRAAELCPTVLVRDGIVYVLGGPGRSAAMAVRAGGSGDVSETHIVWEQKIGSNVSSPALHDGHLYWANDSSGILYCVKAETGETVFEQPLSTERGNRVYASPILSEGRLYFVSRNRGTFVVAAKRQFELLAHNILTGDTGVFNASPAVADGQIFLRSDRFAYCIGKRRR